jgi:hypothetical protein
VIINVFLAVVGLLLVSLGLLSGLFLLKASIGFWEIETEQEVESEESESESEAEAEADGEEEEVVIRSEIDKTSLRWLMFSCIPSGVALLILARYL